MLEEELGRKLVAEAVHVAAHDVEGSKANDDCNKEGGNEDEEEAVVEDEEPWVVVQQ